MSEYRTAEVLVNGETAGILKETDSGYQYTYLPKYLNSPAAPAVSLTLPLRTEPYISSTLFPFFDGLIPEGWLLDIAVHNWKLNRSDRFGLLLLTCRDSIGDVSIREKK